MGAPYSDRMAKHTGKRRSGKRLLKGNVDESLALLTLANSALVVDTFDESVNERTYAISIEASYMLRGLTAGEGPLIFGVAHSDYSAAEIEEVIENAGSWNEGDLVSQEMGRRKVRIIGYFDGQTAENEVNDGKPIKTRLGWILLQGQTLDLWVYNRSGATLTTGAFLLATGHVWLRPT